MGSDLELSYLDRNVESVKNRISAAASATGRELSDITLMAAIKSANVDEILYLGERLGIKDIGENRAQQLLERWDKIKDRGFNLHFIGSLQTNKVKYIIDKVCLIHSLDSDRLAAEIDKQAEKHSLVARVLVEINSGEEENKGGIMPNDAEKFCKDLVKYTNIELCGFMTMAPRCEDRGDYIKYFSKTRELCLGIWSRLGREDTPILSMGMSESFEEAVASGSTLLRVGRTLFEKDNTVQ